MNIFHLSNCPLEAAKWQVDKHISKMGLEHTQLLCTAFWLQGIEAPYKMSHKNHPSAIWVRESEANMMWLIRHSYATFKEYTARYGKRHKSQDVLDWCVLNMDKLTFPSEGLTKFAIAINDQMTCRSIPEFDESDPVTCYRLYYTHDKRHIHNWKQNKPNWI